MSPERSPIMMRSVAIKKKFKDGLRGLFEAGQHFGVNILPNHFYSSIPDIRVLRSAKHWRQPFAMDHVAGVTLSEQVAFLEDLCPASLTAQWQALDVYGVAERENGQAGYGVIEAEILHAFVRRHQPRRVVQVGCGLSTSVILRAASLAAYKPKIICIEPYPSAFLLAAHASGRITLLKERAEETSRETMTGLDKGDMLFVDSTHTVKPGSEVNRIILDVLPRLTAGVFVHFHDIYFPYDYQRGLMSNELFFNAESTLLHAFLINNARYRIVLSLSMLHYAAPRQLIASIPRYEPQGNADGLRSDGGIHFPSATYLLTTEPDATVKP
jgi:predicted O-methyltransferase YrrM